MEAWSKKAVDTLQMTAPGTQESYIMNRMPRRTFLLIAIAALALVTPAPIRAWELHGSALERISLPSGTDMLMVTGARAVIQTRDQIRWQSPGLWQIEQAQITDLNRDGFPEAALLVWRPFKPWPVDAWLPSGGRINDFHNSRGLSCHIILIGWYQNSFRERWAGSALAEPVDRFAVGDLKGDGEQ